MISRGDIEKAGCSAPRRGASAAITVIGAAALGRVHCLGGELHVLMASGGVKVVVLQKHRGGQDDVRVARGVSHELFVDAREQVIARKPAAYILLAWSDGKRVRVLNQHRPHGRAVFQRLGVAGEDRAESRLVEAANAVSRTSRPSIIVFCSW